ncbi:MAG TPA: hypothetical protein VM557_11665 [Thermoanaerobaculia bacterium]|nr:hypothetical protein [Thermoanaerobaculia bacterium]
MCRAIDLDAAIESKADELARTIVRMAADGTSGNLRETLLEIDPLAARRALEETVCLYLFIAKKSSLVFLDEALISPYHRDAFNARMLDAVIGHLTAGEVELERASARISDLWYLRREAYASRAHLYRHPSESLDQTVMYDFYTNILALGSDLCLFVMADLQVPLLHLELSRHFAQLICEAMGIEA